MSTKKPVRGLARSERVFRKLLYLFPLRFREAHSTDALELFRDRYREEYRRAGALGVLIFWMRAICDVLVNGSIGRWHETAEQMRRAVTNLKPSERRKTGCTRIYSVLKDMRCAVRNLRQSPGFTAVTVSTLAIGIGANTALFSVVSGVLLQPLPYEDSERLVAIYSYFTPESGHDMTKYAVGSPEYFDYLDQNRTMEQVAAVSTEMVTITAGTGDPEVITAGYVSSSLFSVLRTPPFVGRTLLAEDDGAKPEPVFVLGHGLWQRRFGGDPNVIGQTLEVGLDMEAAVKGIVVGVMPEGFAFPSSDTALWTQLPLDPTRTWRGGHWFHMIARLAPGVALEQAEAEMEKMMATWTDVHPEHHTGHGLYLMPLLDDYVSNIRPALLLLLGAVGFVLLIACANVTNLLLGRGEARRREIAIRTALGAGRARIVQQLLTESLVLATVAGVIGVILSHAGVDALLALEGGSIPRADLVGLESRVLFFTLGLVLLTSILFGLVPALQAASLGTSGSFKVSSRSPTASRRRMVFRKFLIVSEMTFAILLVVGAGLMTKSFRHLLDVNPGFRTEGMLTARLSLPAADYSAERAFSFFSQLTEKLETLPGVRTAGVASRPPVLFDRSAGRIHIEGRADATPGEAGLKASRVMAGPGFFETLEIPLRRGRLLGDSDRTGAPPSVVIDEEMARRYWPGEDPIGKQIRFARTDGPWHTIVGIVGDVKFDGLSTSNPTYYHYYEQAVTWAEFHARTMTVFMVTEVDPMAMANLLRVEVQSLDPNVPIIGLQTMDDILAASVARPRFMMTLLGVFAGIALILGAIGVYGIMSHGVAQRTHEIGIRMALGADGGEVARRVIVQGMIPALLGVGVGLAAAIGTSHVLSGFLFNVSTTDPWTYAAVSIVMVSAGLLASTIPARRASRVDPLIALRVE